MNLPSPRTRNSLRFSLGRGTTDAEEIDFVVGILPDARRRGLRQHRPSRRRGALIMRVVVAMSGGVDSSVAAACSSRPATTSSACRCSSTISGTARRRSAAAAASTISYDARRVAASLGIPHYIVNFEERFQETVVRNFVDEYAAGRTPIPCVHCNADLKFATLVERAAGFDAAAVATGHYARVAFDEDARRYRLLRSADTDKDQSYFLFSLTQDQLAHAMFPVGHLTKPEVRAQADARGSRRRRQARQPRDLLRAGRRDRRTSSSGSSTSGSGRWRHRRFRRAERSAGTAACIATRSVSGKGLGLSGAGSPVRAASSIRTTRRVVVGPREELGAHDAHRVMRSTGLPATPPDEPSPRDGPDPPSSPDAPATVVADGRDRVRLSRSTHRRLAITPGTGGGVLRRRGRAGRRVDRLMEYCEFEI